MLGSIQLVCFASNHLFRIIFQKLIVAEICACAYNWHAELCLDLFDEHVVTSIQNEVVVSL
jgi:hypothetical protein